MKVEVVTPEDYMGDVIGDLNRAAARSMSMEDTPAGKNVTGKRAVGDVSVRDHGALDEPGPRHLHRMESAKTWKCR